MFSIKLFHSGLIVYVVCRWERAREIKCRHKQCKDLFRPHTDSTDVLHSGVCVCVCVSMHLFVCKQVHVAHLWACSLYVYCMCFCCLCVFKCDWTFPHWLSQYPAVGYGITEQADYTINESKQKETCQQLGLPAPRSTYYGLLLYFPWSQYYA